MRMPVVSDVDNGNGAEAKSIVARSHLRPPGGVNCGRLQVLRIQAVKS